MNIVFSDIDGTFYEMGSEIAPINLDAIDALQNQGDRFVFISGRGCTQIEEMLKELDKECDYIFGNGAGYKIGNAKPIYESCLSLEESEQVIRILEEQDAFYHVHTNQGIYLKPIAGYAAHIVRLKKHFMEELGERGQAMMQVKENYFTFDCQHIEGDILEFFRSQHDLKILKVELMEGDEKRTQEIIEAMKGMNVTTFSSFFTGLEIVHPESNKGVAIERYLQQFPESVTYGVGDAVNDLPMFEAVDVSVAMGNAEPAIQSICQYVTESCGVGGLGQFIFKELIDSKS